MNDLTEGRYSLPQRYWDDRLAALAVDPNRLWAYWDEGRAVAKIAALRLPSGWETAPRQLRVSGSEGDERLLDCGGPCGSWHVEGLHTGARYRVEYGMRLGDRFLPLLECAVRLPGGTGSASLPVREQAASLSTYTLYSKA